MAAGLCHQVCFVATKVDLLNALHSAFSSRFRFSSFGLRFVSVSMSCPVHKSGKETKLTNSMQYNMSLSRNENKCTVTVVGGELL